MKSPTPTAVLLLAALALFSFAAPLWAETEPEQVKLEDLVVTATREVRVMDTPASISVITARDLEVMGYKNIGEALVRLPGVYDDGAASYYLSVRGTRSSSSGGPLVLLDGVPQDLGKSGYNNIETIPVSDIERIEVLRSPGSTAFGADSARGVISIITKSGRKDQPPSLNASASYGSWETWNSYANVSGSVNNWDYYINGSYLDTNGYTANDQTRYGVRLKGGYSFSDGHRIGLNLAYADSEYETVRGKNWYALNTARKEDEFEEKPGGGLVSYNAGEQEVYSYALDYRYRNSNFFLKGLAAATNFEEFSDFRYQTHTSPKSVYNEDRDQDRYKVDFSGGYHFGSGDIRYTPTAGLNMELTTFENVRWYPQRPGKEPIRHQAESRHGFRPGQIRRLSAEPVFLRGSFRDERRHPLGRCQL